MSLSSTVALSIIILHLICISLALPISRQDKLGSGEDEWGRQMFGLFIGVSSSFCLVSLLAFCACCKRSQQFKLHSISAQVERITGRSWRGRGGSGLGSGNSHSNDASEIPLPGLSPSQPPSSSQIYFEPLPDINTLQSSDARLPPLSTSIDSKFSEKWFAEPFKNFPRNQLQYVRKMGSGWFGHVLEGRAAGIDMDHTSTVIPVAAFSKGKDHLTPVVVKALREDAMAQEQTYFLQELLPYRDLHHPNVLKLLAYCIETQPFLILLQFCPKGDLKGLLRQESFSDEALLKMCKDVSSGLMHMHQHNHLHIDLAARNCLVDQDYTVKIGDYGYSVEMYQEEYYLAENVALPLRWCAPETLLCTETTIEMMQLTRTANIWSLGVLLWEILSRGQFPYKDLNEDGVIQKVILDKSIRLASPSQHNQLHSQKVVSILDQCWKSPEERPDVYHLHSLLCHLWTNANISLDDQEKLDFEHRWNQLHQQPEVHVHNISLSRPAELKFESNFTAGPHNGSLKKEEILSESIENLDAKVAATFGSAFPSWLGLEPGQAMDSLTEEISDAIQKLDNALAEEKSELSSSTTSPEKSETTSFVVGEDCLVSNPPTPLHNFVYGESHCSRTLSDGEEELLTLRLEKGEFSELVRIKSQSVQDFMRLTVIDDGSDSDKTSQPGSIDYAEKNYCSESNLKEAIRDAGFMVELERLQSEHKFSIISEVSREGINSLDYKSAMADSLVYNCNSVNTLKESAAIFELPAIPGSTIEKTDKTADLALTLSTSSPDCIVSSRNKHSSTLPDILVHYNANLESKTSSSSSIDVYNISISDNLILSSSSQSLSEDITDKSGIKLEALLSLESQNLLSSEGSMDLSRGGSMDNDQILHSDEFCNEWNTSELKFPQMERLNLPESDSNFSPEDIIKGEEVVIGALDDYSLQPFKPAKSYGFSSNVMVTKEDSSTSLSSISEHDSNSSSHSHLIYAEEVPHKLDNGSLCKGVCKGEATIDNESTLDKISSHSVYLLDETLFGKEILSNQELDIVTSHAKDLLSQPNDNQMLDNAQNDVISKECLDLNFIHLPQSFNNDNKGQTNPLNNKANTVFEESEKGNKNTSFESSLDFNNSKVYVSNSKGISYERELCENERLNNSGEFWEQQMAAWQEAAQQTRELLHKASHPNLNEKTLSLSDSQESEDDMDLLKSPRTPASDGASSKSPFSSTDRLDFDDEETYISYDDTGDEDFIRYSSRDINNLRMELNLKLGNPTEPIEQLEEEEPQENVVINYRTSIPLTLSPIKEESFLSDFEMIEYDRCDTADSLNTDDNSSVEFIEVDDESTKDLNQICLPRVDITQPFRGDHNASPKPANLFCEDGELVHLSIEEARDSLILEDLETSEPVLPLVFGIISDDDAMDDDLLIVDTETNEATLLNSGRPQSHLAFLTQLNEPERLVTAPVNLFDDSDDVAPESLPYAETVETIPNVTDLQSIEKINISSISELESPDKDNQNVELPHYHPYFTSALNSLNHPLPSLEDTSLYDSEEHISLPYDVNYPDEYRDSLLQEAVATDSKKEALFLDDDESSDEAVVIKQDIVKPIQDPDSYVTLSFLGKLYNESQDDMHEYGDVNNEKVQSSRMHYGSNSSEKLMTEEEITEELPQEAPLPRDVAEETPLRTPSHLQDFVWRQESPKAPQESCYTPDWESDEDESDAEEAEDMESSSTSGEFVWQPGDGAESPSKCQRISEVEFEDDNPMSSEEEANEDCCGEDSESGEEEFTPSFWNSELTPQRSLLKSPEMNSLSKKNVHWKRQKHHRVYEYPPEPQSWHVEAPALSSRRSWGGHSLDYLTLADFEIGEDFLMDDAADSDDFIYSKPSGSVSAMYKFSPIAYEDSSPDGMIADDCEFYIRSSGTPFTFQRSSFSTSDFYPGASAEYEYLFTEPQDSCPAVDSAEADGSFEDNLVYQKDVDPSEDPTDSQNCNEREKEEESKPLCIEPSGSMGELKHVKDKLRLDIPSLSLENADGEKIENVNSLPFSSNKTKVDDIAATPT